MLQHPHVSVLQHPHVSVLKPTRMAFYRTTIESVLTYCISAWYSGCTAADKRALQRVINTAQKITGCSLPSLEFIVRSRYFGRANNIMKDSSHPGHHPFTLLPLGIRYRS